LETKGLKMAKKTRRTRPAEAPPEQPVDHGYTPPVEQHSLAPEGRDGKVTDMTGGAPFKAKPPGRPVGQGGRKPVWMKLQLPAHEHEKLARVSKIELRPMLHLVRDCIKIGLMVKEAQRNGEEVVVMANGRRKLTLA
jgi:hypothetical protein